MGSFLQAFLEIYSKAHENSLHKEEVVYGQLDINFNKISDNEIIKVFSNLQLRQNTLVISVAAVADPGCLSPNPGSRVKKVPDPGSELTQKLFLSFRKYGPGCSSGPDPDLDFLPIPDPGVKKAPDPGSATLLVK
jgi:hypothetical protein